MVTNGNSTAGPGAGRPHWPGLALFALAYFGCAQAGHFVSFRPGAFASFWPASGLMVAVLATRRVRTWPWFVASSLLASLVSDVLVQGRGPGLALAIWAGNVGEACLGAFLLRRYAVGPFRCASPQDVLALTLLSGLFSTMVSATIGTAALALAGLSPLSWYSWRVWWGADALGVLMAAPLLLVPGDLPDAGPGARARRWLRPAEFGFVLTALLSLVGFAFSVEAPPGAGIFRMPYLYTVPFLLWAGVRFGQRAGAVLGLLLAVFIAWSTSRGLGPLAWQTHTQVDRTQLLHVFLASILLTSLVLASAVAGLRRVQDLLRASEESQRSLAALQQAILNAANYAIISADPDGTIRTFNAAAERWLGYREDEVVGTSTPAIIHLPGEVEARAAELTRELGRPVAPGFDTFVAKARLGEVDEQEWTYVRRDGGRFPVRLSVTALRDAAGRITGFLGIACDIAEEKAAREEVRRAHDELESRVAERTEQLARANEQLREEERAFRQLADAMPQIVWAAQPDGCVDYYNDRWYEFTGFVRDRMGDESWKPILHPDDLDRCIATWYRSVATGEPYEIQYRFRDYRTGHYRWHLGRALPARDESGRIVRWFGTCTDIDDMRRAEDDRAYLATIVESSGDAIVSEDLDGVVTSWNAGAERLFGYPAAEAVGRPVLFLVPEGREREEAEILARLRDGRRVERFESVRRTKDGRQIDVSLTFSPIRDHAGRILGISKIARDITEKKEAEAAIRLLNADLERRVECRTVELARAKEVAEAASRAKGEFLANMSHEIRTPMNGVLGMTELLLDTSLTPRQREYLGLVKTSADALLEVIDDILDFSKIEAGKLALAPFPFSIRDVVTTTLRPISLRAHDKGLVLACRIDPDVPEVVDGDAGRLRQVLVNLVGNAVKFTERGEVVVDIEPSPHAGGGLLLFSVSDTGIGVPPEKKQAIFAPFEQADTSPTRRFGGTGLGLTISARLVALMGGRIWIEDNPGGGTIFRFTARLAADPEGPSRRPPKSIASIAGSRILLVDDNRTNRLILEELLGRWGVSALAVDGGPAALGEMDAAERAGDPFHAVLLDRAMPGMGGFGLAERIRSDPRFAGTGLLMLSSGGTPDDSGPIRDLRIGGCLLKPVHPSELYDALARLLAGRAGAEVGRDAARREPPAPGPRLRILLVDDHAINQLVATRMLQEMGHEVVVAGDGRAAVSAWAAERDFDVILMDVQMPVMDGFEAVATIRGREAASGGHTPIVALTAHAMNGDCERCLAAGFDDYISKPVDAAKLRAALGRRGGKAGPAGPPAGDGPDFDPAAALVFAGGDEPFLVEMLGLFGKDSACLLDEAHSALDRGDMPALARLGHTIAGLGGNFAAAGVVAAARRLEAVARADGPDDAASALADLDAALGRFRAAVDDHLGLSTGAGGRL